MCADAGGRCHARDRRDEEAVSTETTETTNARSTAARATARDGAGTAAEAIPPFRYTAELANEIEARWQDRWEAEGTFQAPNPTGPLAPADGTADPGGQAVPAGHVPVSVGAGPARRTPPGLHRHRRHGPLHADDRAERAAHHRLRRVRAARRAVRRAHRHPPAGDHRGEHPALSRATAADGLRARPTAQRGDHGPGVLALDAVDLHPAVRGLVRPDGRPSPPDQCAGRRIRVWVPARGRRPGMVRAEPRGAAPDPGRPPAGVHRRRRR